MRRAIALFTAVQLCLGLFFVLASPAQAAVSPVWGVTQVQTTSPALGRDGGEATLTATCPSGQTPISGGYTANTHGATSDIRREEEFTNFGSGAYYRVVIVDAVPASGGTSDIATATVNCVPVSYFSNETLKFDSFTVGADHLAAGSVACDPGWFALSANVTFNHLGETILTSTPDLEFDGWYAKGYNDQVGAAMLVGVHCVPSSDIPGARVYQHADSAGWGTAATSDCPSGLRPITAGTYHVGGDGGGITVVPHATSTGWASLSLSTSGGTMYTNLICIAAGNPTATGSAQPVPNPNSTSLRWTWSANDPAAAGDYGMSFTCTYKHLEDTTWITDYQDQPCNSPVQVDSLADGWYQLLVTATTGDGRVAFYGDYLPVDTTAPTIVFDDGDGMHYPTHSPAVPVHAVDAGSIDTWRCAVDDEALHDCALIHQPATGQYAFELTDVTEGTHTLHVEATDSHTNQATNATTFVVDTTPPTVTETGPSTYFTPSTTVKVTWTGSDSSAGVQGYGVRWKRAPDNAGFGAWSTPVTVGASATSKSFTSLGRGYTYCYEVQGTDKVGNTSAWTPMRCTAIPLDDRDLADSSGWSTSSPAGYFRGTALTTKHQGETLAVTGVTLKRAAVVAKTCSTCGVVAVYVGGTRIGKVDLHAASTSRKVFVLPALASLHTGTVKLKVLSSGKTVQIDALGVSRL